MYLRDIAYSIPTFRLTSAEIAERLDLDVEFIQDKIGVRERAFLGPGEDQVSLAVKACKSLFERNPDLDPSTVQLVLMVTQNPDYRIPHSSALLQDALSLSHDTACFDLNLGCSGYVYALSIAKSFMITDGLSDALLVTCDPYSRIMGAGDRDTISLFGDAATASWLSSKQGANIGKMDFGTDGAGGRHLMVPAGGAAHPISYYFKENPDVSEPAQFRLSMNGRAIFNFMMTRVPISLTRCLKKNRLSESDIDLYVFHQASRFLLDTLTRRLRLDPKKVPCNIERIGNTVSSSIPILLSEFMDNGSLAGKNVIVCGFGVGLSWASNVLTFPKGPRIG